MRILSGGTQHIFMLYIIRDIYYVTRDTANIYYLYVYHNQSGFSINSLHKAIHTHAC